MNIEWRAHHDLQTTLRRRIAPFMMLGLMLLTTEISVSAQTMEQSNPARATYHTVKVDGVDMFYREAGPKDAPVVVLLHGFPDVVTYVPKSHPAIGRQVPRHCSRLPWFWPEWDARPVEVRLHLR